MVNKTLNYYNQNADSFIEGTVSVNFKEVQDKFLQMLSGKKILGFWLWIRKRHYVFPKIRI